MVESPEKETSDGPASPLSVTVSRSQRAEVERRAAEYGASIGRPVSVAEFVRICVLEQGRAA